VFWYTREFGSLSLSLSTRDYDVAFFGPPNGRKNKKKKSFSLSSLSLSLVAVRKQNSSSLSLSFVAADLKSLSSFYDSQRAHKKIYAVSLCLSLLRAFELRDGCVVRENGGYVNFLLFSRGMDKPSEQVFTRREKRRGTALKIGRSEAKNKTKQKAKRSPQNAKENGETQSLMKREREEQNHTRGQKKAPRKTNMHPLKTSKR
jgi:hypothetical protein